MKKKDTSRLSFLLLLIAIVSRFLPHPPNFTGVGATALYGGRYLRGWTAYLVPLGAMAISDAILGLHWTLPFVYISFIISVLLGKWVAKSPKFGRIATATLIGSTVFFILTNFGVWLVTPLYAKTAAGLAQCFVAAIPFAKWTFLSDIAFTTVLFGATELVRKYTTISTYKNLGKEIQNA